MLYGYPGCGKTFFASQFAKEFLDTVFLPSYKMNSELNKAASGNIQLANKAMEYILESYLENGLSVVTDMPVTKKVDRRKLSHMALKHKATPVLVWMQIDAESAYLRTKLRSKKSKKADYAEKYTKQDFQTILSSMQNPEKEDYFVISGKHTYKSQRALVMNKMSALKVINREQASKNIAKPGLVNLVPPSVSGRSGFSRNISVR